MISITTAPHQLSEVSSSSAGNVGSKNGPKTLARVAEKTDPSQKLSACPGMQMKFGGEWKSVISQLIAGVPLSLMCRIAAKNSHSMDSMNNANKV